MRRTTAVLFPWFLLILMAGWIVIDRNLARTDIEIDSVTTAGIGDDDGIIARDVVCGMDVRKSSSYKVATSGADFYFCSAFCRDEFIQNPVATAVKRSTHVMRGIPTWMLQLGVAVILLVSFGLFELLMRSRPAGSGAMERRVDLTSSWAAKKILKWQPLRFVAGLIVTFLFIVIIAAGLFGDQNPAVNIAPLLTWTIWWVGLVFLVLYFGKIWCYICPWDAIATWLERLKFWGPRKSGIGLGLKWPAAFRNIWPAITLFFLLTWIELGMGITMIPRATAYVALGMLGLAIVSVMIFERKSFCRYGCLVGRISGLYSMFSSTELRVSDPEKCASCATLDCYRGNENGDGCPTFQFPKVMKESTYCILCMECVKTCPHDNISVRFRPWGSDLIRHEKPRTDEAILAITLLSMSAFHGLTMTPAWASLKDSFKSFLSVPEWLSFLFLMITVILAPIIIFAALAKVASVWSSPHGAKKVFLEYSYALLPIALFYHLAHNSEHFLMEGPRLLSLMSDPFGWGWNIFGTARDTFAPAITIEGLWCMQVLFIVIGHLYGLWISSKITARLVNDRRRAFLSQLPMLAAMVMFSCLSLWLVSQPMEMRVSAM